MSKLNAGKASILTLTAVLAISAFLFGKSITSVSATFYPGGCYIPTPTPTPVIHKIVTIDQPDPCNVEAMQFSGTLVLKGEGWGTTSDWLVVRLDGNIVYSLEVNDSMTTWQTGSIPVTPGLHALTATIYDSKSGPTYNNEQASASTEYTVDNCPVETPTPTPAPVTPSCSGDQHLDAAGLNCVGWSPSGPAPRNDEGTGVSTGGQVLGASTMAGTGSFDETIFQAIMSVGATLSAFGLKGLKKNKQSLPSDGKKASTK